MNLLPGDGRGERKLIKLAWLQLDIQEAVLSEDWLYQCPAVVRLAFQAGQAQLFGVIWPVNLALFKSSPHVVEPS